MAINRLQVMFYRFLLLGILPLLVSCISSQPYPRGVIEPQPNPMPVVRAPKVGQEWVYQVRNVFNQEIIDTVTERVVSVGSEVRIERFGIKAGKLPDEIQSPWGYVSQDPHWSPPQKLIPPIPLWPEQLKAGQSKFYSTHYQALGYPDGSYYWGLSMNVVQWEWITVPAGKFLTLKFQNEMPYFQSQDVFRVSNYREEDIWLAPEIGRWTIRRGFGRYITLGLNWVNAYWEDYLQWELISWK